MMIFETTIVLKSFHKALEFIAAAAVFRWLLLLLAFE